MNLWSIFFKRSTEQQKCVKQLASLPAFSWTDVCQRERTLLPFCYVSFISTLWFSLESKHRHCFIFIDLLRPICTLYILYLKPVRNMYFSIRTDWNEWMFMYSNTYCCASLLYPSMVGTWRSRWKLNTVWRPQQKHCFKKNKKKGCIGSYCIIQTTLLYTEGKTFCGTLYSLQYITTVEVSVVVSFWINGIYLHDILNNLQICVHSPMDILHSCPLSSTVGRSEGAPCGCSGWCGGLRALCCV